MEIKVNIPTNDYVQPKEIRQEIVQAICDAFLETHYWSIFHPFSGGAYRNPTLNVVPKSQRKRASFSDNEGVRFNGAEMKAAFSALRNAGYHMFKIYVFGSWMGYDCSKKPFLKNGTEVTDFTDFID